MVATEGDSQRHEGKGNMAGSVNKVILVGNLGRDPEIRSLPSGDRLAQLSVATSDSWRDRETGERRERTEWHRVVVFNPHLSEVAERFLRKGSKVYIEGALQTRKWQDQSGADRYSTEIVLQRFRGELQMLDRAGGDGYGDGPPPYGEPAGRSTASEAGGSASGGPQYGDDGGGYPIAPAPAMGDDLDDDIPF